MSLSPVNVDYIGSIHITCHINFGEKMAVCAVNNAKKRNAKMQRE
jgi:hypothetical protein